MSSEDEKCDLFYIYTYYDIQWCKNRLDTSQAGLGEKNNVDWIKIYIYT